MNICEYGCGREAVYKIGKKQKWCCSESFYNCLSRRKKISERKKKEWIENNPSKREDVKEKKKLSCLKHYGVEHPMYSVDVKNKLKETVRKKYGVDHYSQTKEYKEKSERTQIERYGKHYTQTEEYREKSKKTCMEKYGVESPNQSKEVKENKKLSMMEKYGVENPFQVEKVKDKMKSSMKEKYGVEYNLQRPEMTHCHYKRKEYIFPSGKKEFVQGYEGIVIDELLEKYKEGDVIINDVEMEKYIGKIWYIDGEKKRRYFPDIFIKSENKIIEVKCPYTYEKNYRVNMLKKLACENKKLNFDFVIK